MGRKFAIAATAIVTALVTSIFWITAYNIMPAAERRDEPISAAGEVAIVDPQGSAPIAVAEGLVVGPSGMAIPVAGVSAQQLVDTFTQARAGGGRVHDAIDIIAPAGTAVVAAAPGTVEKLYFSRGGGGITAYLRSEDGRWIYYYAHLQEYAPGLADGHRVKRGQ